MSASDADKGALTGGKCPICGAPARQAVRPFCSKRCAEIDLGRWMSGAYVIAGGDTDSDEDGEQGLAGTAAPRAPDSGPDEGTR